MTTISFRFRRSVTHPPHTQGDPMKKYLALLAWSLAACAAQAQNWPDKTVSLVVPFPPGGSTDQVARAIAPRLTDKYKQSFLVDNKAGATGTIGATFVKRAAPDGAT